MKKGFTLIEMLAVIVVLSLVMVISIRSISAVRESQLKKIAEEKIHNIEKAAILYAQENPNVFLGNELTKCSSYNESQMPGISDYKNFDDCIVISAFTLASSNYLDTDYQNGTYILKNDFTGENMLNYNVAIFRDNNRIYSFVSTQESTNNIAGYIPTQQSAPQGGMYSTCSTGYKLLTKVGNKDIYMCGTAHMPSDAHTTTDEQGNSIIVCNDNNNKPVYGNSQHCCPAKINGVEPTYIDGFCVVPNDYSPTCPSGYDLSDNKNICIIKNTLEESTCLTGYTKRQDGGRYLCISNTDSAIKLAPNCSNGKNLTDNQNYCDTGSLTLSNCDKKNNKTYTKMFTNNLYQCVNDNNHNEKIQPTCGSGKSLTFRQLYCK